MEMDDKRIINYLTGYYLGQEIRKLLKTGLGIIIMICIWIIPLWVFEVLNIGY